MRQFKLDLLRNFQFPNTEILEVTHEDCGTYLHITDLPPFTRVLWKNSFGEKSMIYSEIWMPDDGTAFSSAWATSSVSAMGNRAKHRSP